MTVQTIIDLQQSVSVVLTGESAVDIMTEADSNDVTEKLSTGMSGFSFAGGLPEISRQYCFTAVYFYTQRCDYTCD